MKKNFSLGQILSITHEKLMCDIGGVYEILNFMTGDNLYTHQLPRAGRECKPWLLRQHPQLEAISLVEVNSSNWQDVLNRLISEYGNNLEVESIPQDDHDRINPIEEAVSMVGQDKVIVIDTNPSS